MIGDPMAAGFDCGMEETRKAREYAEATCRECCLEQAMGGEDVLAEVPTGDCGHVEVGWCKRMGCILDGRQLGWTREEAGCA